MRLVIAWAVIAAIVTMTGGYLLSSAGQAEPDSVAKPESLASQNTNTGWTKFSTWEKRWWIEKTARLLRAGHGLGPSDNVSDLTKLSQQDIIQHFMQDPRFGDAVLDFNMFFLGFKVDNLKVDGQYTHAAFDFANAIDSTKALLANEDYLRLFDLQGKAYMPPLSVTPSEDKQEKGDARLSPAQLREKAMDELLVQISEFQAMRRGDKPISPGSYCAELEYFLKRRHEHQKRLFRAFNDTEIFILIRAGIADKILEKLNDSYVAECEQANKKTDPQKLDDALTATLDQLERAFAEILNFESTKYGPDSVAEFKPLDIAALPSNSDKWPVFGFEQSSALANSSTNYNRKRAAYVLKRFFCDDLTPVGFDNPKDHVSGPHGTQTSCYSCHYKLDPMAGFFRNYGALFANVSRSSEIVFDDLATMEMKKYLSSWRASDEEIGRKWNVGYVRSPRWTDKNSYGETLSDLSRIIRQAPEAKRCLMKRLTQYTLGEKQTVDGAYLDRLTDKFTEEAKQNSSRAFKNALTRVLMSKAFRTRNPDPKQCYDFANGTDPANRPPCHVASILEKNCVQCHSSTDGLNRLDLAKWVSHPAGGKGFAHLNDQNTPYSRHETLQRIANRLGTNDTDKRMPKDSPMSSQDRQDLYLWVQGELKKMEAK